MNTCHSVGFEAERITMQKTVEKHWSWSLIYFLCTIAYYSNVIHGACAFRTRLRRIDWLKETIVIEIFTRRPTLTMIVAREVQVWCYRAKLVAVVWIFVLSVLWGETKPVSLQQSSVSTESIFQLTEISWLSVWLPKYIWTNTAAILAGNCTSYKKVAKRAQLKKIAYCVIIQPVNIQLT